MKYCKYDQHRIKKNNFEYIVAIKIFKFITCRGIGRNYYMGYWNEKLFLKNTRKGVILSEERHMH